MRIDPEDSAFCRRVSGVHRISRPRRVLDALVNYTLAMLVGGCIGGCIGQFLTH